MLSAIVLILLLLLILGVAGGFAVSHWLFVALVVAAVVFGIAWFAGVFARRGPPAV